MQRLARRATTRTATARVQERAIRADAPLQKSGVGSDSDILHHPNQHHRATTILFRQTRHDQACRENVLAQLSET